MSEDKLPKDGSEDPGGAPDGTRDDLLRRAARAVRASPSLQALVPLSHAEREQLADAAIERALGAYGAPAASHGPDLSSAPSAPGTAVSPSAPAASHGPDLSSAPSAPGTAVSPSAPAPGAPLRRAPAAVAALRRPRFGAGSMLAAVAATFAVAAAVGLVLRGARRPIEPLASYAMVLEGEQGARGQAQPGGAAGEPVKLRPETRLVLRLVTPGPERDALLRLVLVRDGRATLLDPPVTRTAGTLEIAGPAAELLGPQRDGAAELVVVLGRELPGDDAIRALALPAPAEPPRHLQILRRVVLLEGFSHTAIDVLLGGCSAMLDASGARGQGPLTCEIAAGASLQLWVGAPSADAVALSVDGRTLASAVVARGGGSAFDLVVPARTGRLAVRVQDQEIAAWDLAPAASFEPLRAADEARKAGKLDEADTDLDAVSARAPPEQRLEVIRLRAKIAFRRGEVGKERALRTQAIALAHGLGRVSVESDETVAIVHGLIADHAFAEAAQRLHALDALGMRYPEGAMDRDFVRGVLASELGDLGTALAAFRRSLATAERIGDAAGRGLVLAPLADVLQSLGRDGEARAAVDAELQRGDRDADVCRRLDALTNAGWLLRGLDPPRAQRLVDQAAALAGERCKSGLAIALVNQGWLLAAARRFGDARAVLARFPGGMPAPDDRVTTWMLRLQAEILLGEDPAGAEQHAQRLAARATELCSTELLYEAQLLRARALVALDRPAQAAVAFAEAERALTLWSRLVPLGEGRATFFQRHDQLALTAIPFFLAQARRGAPGARLALAATLRHGIASFVTSLAGAGRARARAERGETARDQTSRRFEQTLERWPVAPGPQGRATAVAGVCELRDAEARALDELAAAEPPPHPALLVHPAPEGWLALAWHGSSIDLREIPRAGPGERPDELSARIATAAAPMLAGAPRVDLHVHRSTAALPLDHSLAARLHVPIAFAVDAPARLPGAPCPGPRRALLVTDPRQNLWAAGAAAPQIRADLDRIGLVVDTLQGAAATRAAVEARLVDPCTAVFHYDGHGAAAPAASGPRGDRTDDALLLAGGDTLTATDVLDLPRVPAAVVLNGCTTAAPEGLGLAQAFILAGASQVIASLDELAAADAAEFTNRLFRPAPPSPAGIDLARLFWQTMSGMDIPALRVFER